MIKSLLKRGRFARRAGGYSLLVVGVGLISAVLILHRPMEVYSGIDPGLDSGNSVVDRTTVPGQTILKYTTVGNSTFKAPAGVTSVRVLVVGGGGGGGAGEHNPAGDGGGGGGAGEYVHETDFSVVPGQQVAVTVGAGGAGSTSPEADGGTTDQDGSNGGSSIFGSLTARGGGGGGGNDQHGNDGGSGGGSGGKCSNSNLAGGSSTAVNPGAGNAGGSNSGSGCGTRGAAGGGGAGAAGVNASGSGGQSGGAGLQNDITGTSSFYAAGGAGGGGSTSGAGGNGGSSIGGNGGNASGGNGGIGAANTGSGGGGGGTTSSVGFTGNGHGGDGGSGVVIVRFATQDLPDPGGIPGAVAWYKADSSGNTNSQWSDSSGFDNNLTQGTAGSQPALTTNALNFNPAYVFDGVDDGFSMPTNGIAANDSLSVFFVANATSATGGDRYFNEFGDDRPSISSYNGNPRLYVRDTSSVDDTYSTQEALQPHVYSFVSPNGGGTKVIGIDSREETKSVSGSYTSGGGASGATFGRNNVSSGTSWQGPIAEAIYFNRQLSASERQRVNSYLALKYGITLGTGSIATDYLDSQGSTVWAADNSYKSNIAGIGRDDSSTLDQRQSKSVADGSLVSIGHGDIAATNQDNTNGFANDRAFLIWGHNGAATDQTTVVSGTSYQRMGRVWKSVATGTIGQVKVQIPASIMTRDSAVLLVSDSPAFDGSSQVVPMSLSGSDYEAVTSALSSGTHYFTFASEAGADLEFVDKSATDTSGNSITAYTPGQPMQYRLTVRNNGPDAAGTVTVTDTLPEGIVPKVSGATGNGWDCGVAGQTVTCTRPSLASGVTAPEIKIESTIASSATGQKVNNTATVSAVNDPDLSNNNAQPLALDASPLADLSITKAHTGTPVAGGQLTYDFVVSNYGPSDVPEFIVTDDFDSNLTFSSATPEVNCTGTTSVTCTSVASLAAGATSSFSITVDVDAGFGGGSILNTASVDVPDGVTDPNASNNTSNQDETGVSVSVDLSVSKSHTGDFIAGEQGVFVINVTNNGPSNAPVDGITVIDTLDEDFSFVSASGTNWTCSNVSSTVSCTYGAALAADATTEDIALTVLVDSIADTPTDNTVEVAGTAPDPDLSNNKHTDTVDIVAEADLAIVKSHIGSAFTPGQQGQYVFTVTNSGPSADSPSYQITDTLPAGLTYAGQSGDSAADCSSSSGVNVVCNGGAIPANGESQTTTIIVDIDPGATGTFNNSATVATAPGVTDPNPANNTSDDTVDIEPNADLSVSKVAPGTIVAGGTAEYTVTTVNNGPSNAPSYTLTDTLDPNLTFQSSTPNGACSVTGTSPQGGQEITCNGEAITGDGAQDTITITAQVQASATPGLTINNLATVVLPAGVNDPNPSNNTSVTVSSTVTASADIAVAKAANNPFTVGQSGTFDITVTNNGPSDAATVTVTDALPEGLTYVSTVTNSGPEADCSAAGQVVTCQIGPTLGSGEATDFTITVMVNPDVTAASLENTATASSTTSDPNTGNNQDTTTVNINPAQADLEAAKTLQGSMTAGESATYRFEVTNNGPDNAGVVTINDELQSYLTYQSFSSVNGDWSCDAVGQEVTCSLPVLANGETSAVDVAVLVAQDGPETADNSATVTFNGNDPTPNNPSASDPVSHVADLEVQLSHESKTYHSGDKVEFNYTVINHGPSAAKDVVLTDALPEGLTFESIVASSAKDKSSSLLAQAADLLLGTATVSAAPNTPFSCTNSGQNIACSADILMTGTYGITMTAQISDSFTGDLTSTAQITSSTDDPNPANNTSVDTIVGVAPLSGGLAGTGQNMILWLVVATSMVIAALWIWRRRAAVFGG